MRAAALCQRHGTVTGRVLCAEEIRIVAAAGNASLCWGVVDARMGLANRVVGLQPCSPRSHSQKWLLRRVGANLQIHPALFSHECLELATQREAELSLPGSGIMFMLAVLPCDICMFVCLQYALSAPYGRLHPM